MPNRFNPMNPNASQSALVQQLNRNFSELDREAVTKVFKDGPDSTLSMGKTGENTFGIKMTTGDSTIDVGKLPDGDIGIGFSDGTTTFLKLTQDGLVLNDGINDRVLIGKQTGGF